MLLAPLLATDGVVDAELVRTVDVYSLELEVEAVVLVGVVGNGQDLAEDVCVQRAVDVELVVRLYSTPGDGSVMLLPDLLLLHDGFHFFEILQQLLEVTGERESAPLLSSLNAALAFLT